MLEISKKIYNFVVYIKNKMMRKRLTKKDPAYMLFVFGDFEEHEYLATNLSSQLLTVVSSPFLKFTYGEYGVVFHFRSKEEFNDLKEYIDMAMSEITEQYFLMESTNKVDIKMPKKLKKDFLNIDGETTKTEPKNGKIDIEELKEKRNKDMKNIALDIFLPIFDTNSVFNFKENEVEHIPTVDEILDKISEKGIESLTEKEKEILDNYGKRKNGRH
jgi:hypothetical protein